ncbi:hypothetical protein GCM10012275_15150 [Longimycelium tulufanense]|uniref:Uncharacterized protein n=1 Tax=Longimycelium tulufanense TaxID=907463 RepID=A0A8J3C9D6_9PSEU|nr:hypothetical protein [Longimycelium tulufanense]GGM45063.1 hypothetical protein GCM10012275_15150 [Longimycelium tulufanense]
MSSMEEALQNLMAAKDNVPQGIAQHGLQILEQISGQLAQAGVTDNLAGLLEHTRGGFETALQGCAQLAQQLDERIAHLQAAMGGGGFR